MNRNLEDNLIVNLKNEIYELKKENTELKQQLSQLHKENQQLKEKLLKIFENIDISYNELKNWKGELSKLQQENEQLKADYGNKAQVERDILLQQKEELIKWLEKKIKKINPKKLSNSELYKITSDMKMQRYYAYVNVLLKLKESDK